MPIVRLLYIFVIMLRTFFYIPHLLVCFIINQSWMLKAFFPGLLRPWDSPGKCTGVGCHFLLQNIDIFRKTKATEIYWHQTCSAGNTKFSGLNRNDPKWEPAFAGREKSPGNSNISKLHLQACNSIQWTNHMCLAPLTPNP